MTTEAPVPDARAYLLDAGPLAAAVNRRDQHHAWAVRTLDRLDAPLLSCEAVLSEAWFLARRGRGDPAGVLDLVAALDVQVVPAWSPRADAILRRYADRASVAGSSRSPRPRTAASSSPPTARTSRLPRPPPPCRPRPRPPHRRTLTPPTEWHPALPGTDRGGAPGLRRARSVRPGQPAPHGRRLRRRDRPRDRPTGRSLADLEPQLSARARD